MRLISKVNGKEVSFCASERTEKIVSTVHGVVWFVLIITLLWGTASLVHASNFPVSQEKTVYCDGIYTGTDCIVDLGEPSEAFFLGYDYNKIKDFVKKYEGFRHCAYPDLGGGFSIGYGTVSFEGECVSEEEADTRLESALEYCVQTVWGKTGMIPQDHMTALADVLYNVRPRNYNYVLNAYNDENRGKELGYALRMMSCSWSGDECVRHGGLVKRFNDRISLLFKNNPKDKIKLTFT